MSNLTGTRWVRNSDNTLVTIESDSNMSGGGNRSLRAVNASTGRSFWVTPEGLRRKYYHVTAERYGEAM